MFAQWVMLQSLKEIAEAFQMASLKQLPILFLVQDNEWDISAYSDETRVCNAHEYSKGFGLESYSLTEQILSNVSIQLKKF